MSTALQVAQTVLEDVFQSMAFIFLEPDQLPTPLEPINMGFTGTGITFTTSTNKGSFELWADSAFLAELSQNMIGNDSQGLPCLHEMLNIVTGNFLTAFFGFSESTHLNVPQELKVFGPHTHQAYHSEENAYLLLVVHVEDL